MDNPAITSPDQEPGYSDKLTWKEEAVRKPLHKNQVPPVIGGRQTNRPASAMRSDAQPPLMRTNPLGMGCMLLHDPQANLSQLWEDGEEE